MGTQGSLDEMLVFTAETLSGTRALWSRGRFERVFGVLTQRKGGLLHLLRLATLEPLARPTLQC